MIPLNTQTSQVNIKSEMLDDQPQMTDPLDCPISIIPAGQSTTNLGGGGQIGRLSDFRNHRFLRRQRYFSRNPARGNHYN